MSNFFERVYHIVSQIPEGKVATYGQIAGILGNPRGARTVGWAMQAAPESLTLPCHRVVNIKGEMAPGFIFGGEERQRAILKAEGVIFTEEGNIDMAKSKWYPENLIIEI